jgi:hypothetical protein
MRILAWCGISQSISDGANAGGLAALVRDFGEHADGKLEHRLPIHAQERIAGHLAAADAARNRQDPVMGTVGMQGGSQNSRLVRSLEHDRTGTIAEEHAGASIRPVENARKHLGADHQSPSMTSRTNELLGNRQP